MTGLQSVESIASHFDLSRALVRDVLEFLTKYGLVVQSGNGFQMGPSRTHLENSSLLVTRHHTNWRLKSLERMAHANLGEEIFYTAPMTLSNETLAEIKSEIVELIDWAIKKVGPSPSEQMACLNIDLFKVGRSEY
jgi:DNA-binding FadR family transcriptional regulator